MSSNRENKQQWAALCSSLQRCRVQQVHTHTGFAWCTLCRSSETSHNSPSLEPQGKVPSVEDRCGDHRGSHLAGMHGVAGGDTPQKAPLHRIASTSCLKTHQETHITANTQYSPSAHKPGFGESPQRAVPSRDSCARKQGRRGRKKAVVGMVSLQEFLLPEGHKATATTQGKAPPQPPRLS